MVEDCPVTHVMFEDEAGSNSPSPYIVDAANYPTLNTNKFFAVPINISIQQEYNIHFKITFAGGYV